MEDLEGLQALSEAISDLVTLAGDDEERLDKAETKVRHHLVTVCIAEGINLEFIDSFLRNRGGI